MKLVKYAAKEGWSFVVFTQDPNRPVFPEPKLSESLLDELPKDLHIEWVPSPLINANGGIKPFAKICGRSSLLWGLSVFWRGLKYLREHQVDLIFANTPPFTNAAIGALLSITRSIPLLVDFRDDWVGSPAYLQKNRVRQHIEAFIEACIVRLAKKVFIVTEDSYQAYSQRYSVQADVGKFQFVPNGHDMGEFQIIEGRERRIETHHFTLLSAVSGYRPDYRDLSPFLDSLESFITRCPEAKQNIELVFLGEDPDQAYLERLNNLGLKDAVTLKRCRSRKELVEWLWKADLFFLVQPIGNRTAVSGTLYEYWATGKAPILLISEEGACSKLVKRHFLGKHVHFSQSEVASAYLEKNYQAYRDRQPVWINRDGIEMFDRKSQVMQILASFQDIIDEKARI